MYYGYSYDWSCISTIESTKLEGVLVPYRLTLHRNGNVVTAAGWSWTEAAVALFSTADLGRFTPYVIGKVLLEKFGSCMDEGIQNFLSLVDSESARF